jgi:hypothetical protein
MAGIAICVCVGLIKILTERKLFEWFLGSNREVGWSPVYDSDLARGSIRPPGLVWLEQRAVMLLSCGTSFLSGSLFSVDQRKSHFGSVF